MKINHDLNLCFIIADANISVQNVIYLLDILTTMVKDNNIKFIYEKGKRKSKLQRYTEQLNKSIKKQSKYDKYNSIFNGRNRF